jgi:hypothetical protein
MEKSTLTLSMAQPVPAPLQSVARRKRKTTFCCHDAEGIMANVVLLEFPVHAARPARGLWNAVEMVPL